MFAALGARTPQMTGRGERYVARGRRPTRAFHAHELCVAMCRVVTHRLTHPVSEKHENPDALEREEVVEERANERPVGVQESPSYGY